MDHLSSSLESPWPAYSWYKSVRSLPELPGENLLFFSFSVYSPFHSKVTKAAPSELPMVVEVRKENVNQVHS